MKETRFRAYQLGTKGSSFSYTVGNHITLIEARYNDTNKENIKSEVQRIRENRIDCLHITSWDVDHCNYDELLTLLIELSPRRIDYPWYMPDTESGLKSKALIEYYENLYPERELPEGAVVSRFAPSPTGFVHMGSL